VRCGSAQSALDRARRIDILLRSEHGPHRDALAAGANMAASGGTLGTYLWRLRINGLIREERGRVHLVEELRGG
jgi:hypothetical protein